MRWALIEGISATTAAAILAAHYRKIAKRRGKNKARVAFARKVLTLVYYGLRDGEIRCLAPAQSGVTLGHGQAASSRIGMTHHHRAGASRELIEPTLVVAHDRIMRVNPARIHASAAEPAPPHGPAPERLH